MQVRGTAKDIFREKVGKDNPFPVEGKDFRTNGRIDPPFRDPEDQKVVGDI